MQFPDGFEDWARSTVEGLGAKVASVEPRLRSWSINLKLSTDHGAFWAKANCPGADHESAVVSILGSHFPETLTPPVAVSQSWFLTRDAGPILRETDFDITASWMTIVGSYSLLQRQAAEHCAELLAAGVPDLRPEAMPAIFDHLLSTPDAVGLEGLAQRRDSVLVDSFAIAGRSPSIQHDDIHTGNIFAEDLRIFDWGDAVIAHPFGSLLCLTRSIASDLNVDDDDPSLDPFIDHYLAEWSGELADKRKEARLAMRLAAIGRAAGWERLGAQTHEAHPDPISAWLEIFLAFNAL